MEEIPTFDDMHSQERGPCMIFAQITRRTWPASTSIDLCLDTSAILKIVAPLSAALVTKLARRLPENSPDRGPRVGLHDDRDVMPAQPPGLHVARWMASIPDTGL
jgi:hypothetical protein